ncbi:MAG: hypothetical protein ACTSQE_07490 [Candidatus Heimdallarchaeaceae archaeon]
MPTYKNILSGYVNERQDGKGHYLVITNTSDRDITIPKGEKVYLNRTSKDILDKHPKVPHYSKSEKIEDEAQEPQVEEVSSEEVSSEEVADSIPF